MTITLRDDNDREIHLPLRTREIIRRTIEVMPQVEAVAVGSLILHLRGRSIIPEVSERFRETKTGQ